MFIDTNFILYYFSGKDEFVRTLKVIEEKLEQEKLAMVTGSGIVPNTNIPNNSGLKVFDKKQLWTKENIQLLIKAVNLFPAGTIQRWEVIANFINLHGTNMNDQKFYAKEVLNKAKDLQHTDYSKNELKVEANQNAFHSFEKQKKELKKLDEAEISVNLDVGNKTGSKKKEEKSVNGGSSQENQQGEQQQKPLVNGDNQKPQKAAASATAPPSAPPSTKVVLQEAKAWTTDEQALLEQAIKTYPVSLDRWDRIAECIPNRSKKDCLRRVKELVDLVNAKRDAQSK
jgi:DnaJ homolog subfamily C member 2